MYHTLSESIISDTPQAGGVSHGGVGLVVLLLLELNWQLVNQKEETKRKEEMSVTLLTNRAILIQ